MNQKINMYNIKTKFKVIKYYKNTITLKYLRK